MDTNHCQTIKVRHSTAEQAPPTAAFLIASHDATEGINVDDGQRAHLQVREKRMMRNPANIT